VLKPVKTEKGEFVAWLILGAVGYSIAVPSAAKVKKMCGDSSLDRERFIFAMNVSTSAGRLLTRR
jgi:hypothetical protein